MPTAIALVLILSSQVDTESVFNTYGTHLEPVRMPGGCAPTRLDQFGNRTYRFRDAPMYPRAQPLTLVNGRAVERNVLGSIEWESTLDHAEFVRLGELSAVLLKITANHAGGTGSIAYVLVVQCRAQGLQVLFEASGPIKSAAHSSNGELALSHGVWSREDSHASPSREVTERFKWVAERARFVLIDTISRQLPR